MKRIARMHAAGLRVLQGTLTPAGGDVNSSYGGAPANAIREQVNTWIRTQSPADGVIDFNAAVRDPSDPSRINPAYDGGDHLHFNPTGLQAMANAINLSLLRRAACTEPKLRLRLRLRISPRRVKAGEREAARSHEFQRLPRRYALPKCPGHAKPSEWSVNASAARATP